MTEEEKKKMTDLEAKVTEQAAQITTLTGEKDTLTKTVAEKDAIIVQKNQDLVGQRKEYKKLSEMTDAEKAEMTSKEIELQTRQEQFEADQKAFKDEQEASRQKDIAERRGKAIDKLAGKDPEVRKKIEDNISRIVDHDKAQTEDEVKKLVDDAFGMTGLPKPSAFASINDGGNGGTGEGSGDANFADSQKGKELASMLSLPVIPPAAS